MKTNDLFQDRRQLIRETRALTPAQRELLSLLKVGGLNAVELPDIAQALGIAGHTATQRLATLQVRLVEIRAPWRLRTRKHPRKGRAKGSPHTLYWLEERPKP